MSTIFAALLNRLFQAKYVRRMGFQQSQREYTAGALLKSIRTDRIGVRDTEYAVNTGTAGSVGIFRK
jgi:hypothetical protein